LTDSERIPEQRQRLRSITGQIAVQLDAEAGAQTFWWGGGALSQL